MDRVESARTGPARGGGTPDLAEVLSRIEARLARIERAVDAVQGLTTDAQNMIATATDVLDERLLRLGDVEERLTAASDVVERLTRPNTLASLGKLVDLAENAPGLLATFTDMFDEVMAEAGTQGLALSDVIESMKRLTFGLLKLTTSTELRALLDSGMLDPRALTSLGEVASALVRAREGEAPRVGVVGALRALGRSDVQRAVGFLLQVAADFGRVLEQSSPDESRKRLSSGSRHGDLP